eukprot:s51_g28.t1
MFDSSVAILAQAFRPDIATASDLGPHDCCDAVTQMKDGFAAHDVNKDGKLSREEMNAMPQANQLVPVTYCGPTPVEPAPANQAATSMAQMACESSRFAGFDTNRDEVISSQEIAATQHQVAEMPPFQQMWMAQIHPQIQMQMPQTQGFSRDMPMAAPMAAPQQTLSDGAHGLPRQMALTAACQISVPVCAAPATGATASSAQTPQATALPDDSLRSDLADAWNSACRRAGLESTGDSLQLEARWSRCFRCDLLGVLQSLEMMEMDTEESEAAASSPRPESFQLVGQPMLGRSLHHGLVSFLCGSFVRKELAVITHPQMLSGVGITATSSRVKDVITNKAALQVVRAHLIACLDFSALITGLLDWHLADDSLQADQQAQNSSRHGCYTLNGRLGFKLESTCGTEWPAFPMHLACYNSQACRFCRLMSDKAPVCLLGSGILQIETASEWGSMLTLIACGLSRLRILGYAMVMCFGFLTFGTSVSGNVLLNYDSSDPWATAARLAVGVSMLFGYPMQFAGFRDGLLELFHIDPLPPVKHRLVTGSCLLLAVGVACVFRDLGVAVEGALLAAFLVFLAGPIMALRLPMGRRNALTRLRFRSLIVLGVAFMGVGCAIRVTHDDTKICSAEGYNTTNIARYLGGYHRHQTPDYFAVG